MEMRGFFPAADDPSRIPSLDGLRAVSISLVLFSHLLGTQYFFGRRWLQYAGDLGNLGVRCFFVISGFLITTLLLQELEHKCEISLKHFYLRRTFRIFPAFYVCLGTVAALYFLNFLKLNPHDLLYAGTYTINYRTAVERSWNVGHMWSLAVEEQFYLLWPATIWLLGRRRALGATALVILLVPLVRIATWRWFPDWTPGIKWQFQTVCDSLATGCLLAGLQGWLAQQKRLDKLMTSNALLLLPILAGLMNLLVSGRPRLNFLVGQTFMNLCLAIFIHHCICHPGQWAGRFLNLRPAVIVGVLSYSLYLWQQLFLNHYSRAFVCSFPANILLTLAAASLSYALVEKPCLNLRKRVESRLFNRRGRLVPIVASQPAPQ
jgi:peptidoglycan/LPS O-acetylase OafA/YrhL